MLENTEQSRTTEILLSGMLASSFPNLNCTPHLYKCLPGRATLWPTNPVWAQSDAMKLHEHSGNANSLKAREHASLWMSGLHGSSKTCSQNNLNTFTHTHTHAFRKGWFSYINVWNTTWPTLWNVKQMKWHFETNIRIGTNCSNCVLTHTRNLTWVFSCS